MLGGIAGLGGGGRALRLRLRALHQDLLRHPHAWRCPRCCGASPSSSSGSPGAATASACPRRRSSAALIAAGRATSSTSSSHRYYYYVLAIFAVCTALMWVIVHSPFGKALQAIRDNETRAEFVGVQVLALPLGGLPDLRASSPGWRARCGCRSTGSPPPTSCTGPSRARWSSSRCWAASRPSSAPSSARSSSTTSRPTRWATPCTGRWCWASCWWCWCSPCPRASWARCGRLAVQRRRRRPRVSILKTTQLTQVLRRHPRGGPRGLHGHARARCWPSSAPTARARPPSST